MIIATIILLLAGFGCFAGFMFIMGYWEFHDKKEMKQGIIMLVVSIIVIILCCGYLDKWFKGLGQIETPVEYPSVLEYFGE